MSAIRKQCECCDVQQLIDQVSLLTDEVNKLKQTIPEVLTDKEDRVLIIPKSGKKCELIDGQYYKCWLKENQKEPFIRKYCSSGMHMYDGSIEMRNTSDYDRIEPLNAEPKKYGLWVATDKNGGQWLYKTRPIRDDNVFAASNSDGVSLGQLKILPDQTWEDEPVEI